MEMEREKQERGSRKTRLVLPLIYFSDIIHGADISKLNLSGTGFSEAKS